MRPMAAAVATDEPDAAAKPAQARLVATASPPGNAPNHSRAALNSAVEMPELWAIEPIKRNIGMAVRVQLAPNSKGVSLMMPKPTEIPRKFAMPSTPMAPSATPMGRRSAINSSTAPMLQNPRARGVIR